MKIYNTLSGEKEKILKPVGRPLHLFVCGPTVYDDAHIGHARTYLSFDFFVRYMRSLGFRVFYLQNITNIDDKIIGRAKKENKKTLVLANFFEDGYCDDMKSLGISSINRYARATDFIPQIVKQVQTLIKKNFAYQTEDGYYFDIKKFKDYGKLSRRTVLQAEDAVSRIDESVEKRNKGDFCLWKFSPPAGGPNEPSWATSLGKGRPGWHIEDTAITEKFFGPQYDIHGGGVDLKFPHHEAEIAQQEAASGKKPFVRIWMHTGFLTVNGKKMSKSLKNFITIREFLKKHSPELLRFLVFRHHYRAPLNYSDKLVEQSEKDLVSIKEFMAKLEFVKRNSKEKKSILSKHITATQKLIRQALSDDFNTPFALAEIFKFISSLQNRLWLLSKKDAQAARNFIVKWLETFGFKLTALKIPKKITALLKRRELFRVNKQFTQADALRKRIRMLGYVIEDTTLGPMVLKNN